MCEPDGGQANTLVPPDEIVIRLCFSANRADALGQKRPQHADPETGFLYEEAVQMQDLTKRGFSLQRAHLYQVERAHEAERRLRERHADAEIRLQGGVASQVSTIHAIADDDGSRVFSVRPDEREGDPSHAMVRSELPKSKLLKFRPLLLQCFSAVQPIEDLVPAD